MVSRPVHYNTRYKHELTPRQCQVLDLIVRGYTNSEIAVTLDVSLDGAKWHVSEILAKLGVDTREQAADYWRAYNRPLAKAARAFAGLGSFGGTSLLKIAAATVAVTAVAAGAIALYAALGDGGGSKEPSTHAGALPCEPDDVGLRVSTSGGGTNTVTILTEAMLTRACALPRRYLLTIEERVTGGRASIQGNPANVEIPAANGPPPGEWVAIAGFALEWTNWCAEGVSLDAVARVGTAEARAAISATPPCEDARNPSVLWAPAALPRMTPSPMYVSVAARMAAQSLAEAIARGDVPAIAAMNRPTEYTCPGAPGATPVPVCDDGQEHHLGMISTDGGGQAAIYPLPRFEQFLRQAISPSLRLKTIGCPVSDIACNSFVLGFEYANAPGTGLYFAFEPWPDGAKTGIFAHGTIAGGSSAVLTGGGTETVLGETAFVAAPGEALPPAAPTAGPVISDDVRAFADRLAALVAATDVAGLVSMSSPQRFTCPGGRGEGSAPLCDGGVAGEVRQGFRFTMHGSEGEVRTPAGFEQELRVRVQPTARLASIGCGDGKDCSSGFVVAFVQPEGEQPAVFYFALSYLDGEPRIVGYGLSGDNADTIVKGGATQSWMGSTVFVPVK